MSPRYSFSSQHPPRQPHHPSISPGEPATGPQCLPTWLSTSMAMSMNMSCSSRMLFSSLMISLCRVSISFSACLVMFESMMICKKTGPLSSVLSPSDAGHQEGGTPLHLLAPAQAASSGETQEPCCTGLCSALHCVSTFTTQPLPRTSQCLPQRRRWLGCRSPACPPAPRWWWSSQLEVTQHRSAMSPCYSHKSCGPTAGSSCFHGISLEWSAAKLSAWRVHQVVQGAAIP